MSTEISATPDVSQLRECPSCGKKVISPITDLAIGDRICHHCAGPHVNPDIIRFAKKMQDLFDAGRLSEKTYPLSERVLNLAGVWDPIQ